MMNDIRRGDIYIASIPGDSHETRPVLVVSSKRGCATSPYISVVPLSLSNRKEMGTHVEIIGREKSMALCERVTTLRRESFSGTWIRTATDEEMTAVDKALCLALDLNRVEVNVPKKAVDVPEEAVDVPEKETDAPEQVNEGAPEAIDNAAECVLSPVIDEEKMRAILERDIYKSVYLNLVNATLYGRRSEESAS